MTLEAAAHFATAISVIIAVITLAVGIVIYKRQVNAQIFLEYTKRYEEIMRAFPSNAWAARLDLQTALPEASEELSLSVLRYLNLCAEEFYLCQRRYLDKSVWKIWEDELIRTLCSPLFRREWKALRSEFESYPEFRDFVEKAQKDTN